MFNTNNNASPFKQLLFLAAIMIVGAILTIIIESGMQLLHIDTNNYYGILTTQTLAQFVMFLLPAYLFALRFQDSPKHFFKADIRSGRWGLCLLACLMTILAIPSIDWLTSFNDSWHWSGSWQHLEEKLRNVSQLSDTVIDQILSKPGFGNLLLNILVIALVPAVCEEFLFRGVLQQFFLRWMRNPHIAIISAAAIFSLFHGQFFAFLPRFAIGIVLGYLFYYSRSIFVNISAHFLNNAIIVISSYLYHSNLIAIDPGEPLNLPIGITIACLLALFVCFFLYFYNREDKHKTSENQ